MDDRVIMYDTHIWTDTDLESYVINYYVHRQVRAVLLVPVTWKRL